MSVERLYLDFGSNTEIGAWNKDKICKVGLKDQFERLPIECDYEFFVERLIAVSNAEVGISYPSFERKEPSDEGNNWFNIAVRIPVQQMPYDVVMMCDLNEHQPKNKPMLRALRVKGFTLLDRGTNTCGEIRVVCDIFTRLVFNDGWSNENFGFIRYLSEEDINLSVLTIPFLRRLNKEYVAKPHQDVISRLDMWQKYLDAKNEVILKDRGEGYSIDDGPELLLGYFKSGHAESEKTKKIKHLIVARQKDIWSTEEMPGSQKIPLLRVAHDFLKKDYEKDEGIKKKFGRFTGNRSLIISEKLFENNKGNNRFFEYPSSVRLSESKISSEVYEEEIRNLSKINRILEERDRNIASMRLKIDGDRKEEVDSLLKKYSSSELPAKLDVYRKEQGNLVRDEAISKRNVRIQEEEKTIELDTVRLGKTIKSNEAKISDTIGRKDKLAAELDDIKTLHKKVSSELRLGFDARERIKASNKLKEVNEQVKKKESDIETLEKEIENLTRSIIDHNKSLEKLKADKAGLSEKHALEKIIEELVNHSVQRFRDESIESQRRLFENDLRPEYEKKFLAEKEKIVEDADETVEKVIEDETRIRLHVFYRLDMDTNEDPENILRNQKSKISDKEMYLYKDFSGDEAIIKRQTIALDNLRKGNVMNPFLATALFNKGSKTTRKSMAEIDHYYSEVLNDKQREAVKKAIASNGLFLIRGPPGTGKTEVIAEITAQLVTNGKKVLIASENHKAVDNAFVRLPKLPILRRMRLFGGFSAKKEETNQYAVRALTRNFYSDIAKCLEDEVRKASNFQKYAGNLDRMIGDFKSRAKEVRSLENKAKEEMGKIAEIEKSIKRLNRKISKDLEDNAEYDAKISEIKESIKNIENIDRSTFDDLTSSVNVEHDGQRLSPETIRALYGLRKTDINREYNILGGSPELLELLMKKSDPGDEREKKTLDVRILNYQKEHNINIFELRIIKIFPAEMPDRQTVLDLKEEIEDQIQDIIDGLEKEKEKAESICNDTSRNEQNVKHLERELQDLRSGAAVKEYEHAFNLLDADIRKMLSNTKIQGSFKTFEEGIGFIESEKSRIKRVADSGLSESLQNSYRKMADYLRDESVIESDEKSLNEELLDYANVIGLTCTTKDNIKTEAGDVDLRRANLDVVIVDEVSKVSFLEVLYPIMYGKTVILVGDDKQLAPMYQENAAKEDMERYDSNLVNPELEGKFRQMYEYSFFKELYSSMPECDKTMLTVQYRMHPDIMEAVNIFYDGRLTYGGEEGGKQHHLEIKGNAQRRIITKNSHLVFIDVEGEEIRGNYGGTSYVNSREVEVITNLLKKMESSCTKDRDGRDLGGRKFDKEDTRLSLGVICGYSDQAKLIRNELKSFKFQSFNRDEDEQFMVDTVDNFQGDERDIIILSLVRSRPGRSFMTTFNRINVAISRARRLLVVVGHARAFSDLRIQLDERNDTVYRRIVDLARSHHGVFTDKDVLGE